MKSILIVDDIKVNLKVLEVLLTRNGYNTTSALSGTDALSLLRIKPIDLIISDILMPGMDGFQFCRLCKLDENLKAIPFIFYSSTHTEAKARQLARKMGATAFITKPADPAMLLKTIDNILDGEEPPLPVHEKSIFGESGEFEELGESEEKYPEPVIQDTRDTQPPQDIQSSCRALLKNIPCAVWTVDAGGNIVYVSPAVEEITGFTMDHILKTGKRQWLTRVQPSHGEKVRNAYRDLYQNQIALDIEYPFECQNGEFIWLHEKSGTPYTKNGIRYVDGVSIDVSEKKQIQAHQIKFREHQAMQTLTKGVAHDLNTLLTGITGYIELSRMEATTPAEQHHFLTNALDICGKASALTRKFFALASNRKPVKDGTLLADVVTHAIQRVPETDHVQVKLEIPRNLWPCRVDPIPMTQALENVLINAKEALETDGFIEVILQNLFVEDTEFISNIVLSPGYYTKITIRDNGRGIAAEHLHRIFHPYFTTKARDTGQGLGLGLSLSQAVITRHSGVIAVTSQKRTGTTMDIYLPVLHPGEADAMDSSRVATSQTKKLLIMDADEMVREITCQILERAGFNVTCVKTGSDAVKTYGNAMASDLPFSVVILDLMTDEDDTGVTTTLKQLRKINPGVQIIVSSGYPSDPVIKQYKQYGFNATLSKPYVASDLVAVIKELLSS